MSKHRAARLRPLPRLAPRPARRPAPRLLWGPLVVTLLTALCTLGGTTAATAPTAAAAPLYQGTPAMAPSTYERRVQYWVNERRRHRGLHRLRVASCTARVADRWSRRLALTDKFHHQRLMRILVRCNAYYAGETLGRGSITPRRLVYLWMHSPEHRAVLLSPHARTIGIGSYPDRYGRWVTAADFMHF